MQPATKEVFDKKLQYVEKQYSSRYMPGSQFTQFVDGKRTLSENVADIDGLKIASKAYDLRRQREGLPPASKAEFFKGFAQSFCENMSPEDVKPLYAHDEHAPSKVRVNVALLNNDEFAATFACTEEAMMSSPDKCYVWSDKPSENARQENDASRIVAGGMCVSFMTASFLVLLFN